MKHVITFSTYVGFFFLIRKLYKSQKFILKYLYRKTNLQSSIYNSYGDPNQRSWAIVTGGTAGSETLGFQICKILASKGFNICMIGKNENKLKTALEYLKKNEVKENNFQTKYIEADFS